MAVGQQTNGQPFHQIILADDDLGNFTKEGPDKGAGPLHLIVDGTDSGIHNYKQQMIMPKRQPDFKLCSEKILWEKAPATHQKDLRRRSSGRGGQFRLKIHDLLDLRQKPTVNFGHWNISSMLKPARKA